MHQKLENQNFLGDIVGAEGIFANAANVGVNDSDNDGVGVVACAEVLGFWDKVSLNIIITTTDPMFSLMVGSVLRFLLVQAKMQLHAEYGFLDATFGERDFQWSQDYWPVPVWARAVTLDTTITKTVSVAALADTEREEYLGAVVPATNRLVTTMKTCVTGTTTTIVEEQT